MSGCPIHHNAGETGTVRLGGPPRLGGFFSGGVKVVPPIFTTVAIVTLPGESRAACRDRLTALNCLPCGTLSLVPIDWSALPLEDVPCPCGDPSHWLVRWWDTPAEG